MAKAPREPRYLYGGKVRLMVPFPPWRLVLTMRANDLSTSGLGGLLASKDHDLKGDDLLVPGDPYELQLEHDVEHLPAPFVRARLARRVRTAAGLILGFSFDTPPLPLLGLVHELSVSGANLSS